jgi:uncharacterized protein YdhG (YjbR/CyaY superfamily)
MKSATKKAETRGATAKKKTAKVFSDAELEAIKEAKRERGGKVDGESDLRAKIAEMTGRDRELAERIHAIVKANAPSLAPKTWYGMPAYAREDGKLVCFFTPAGKFKSRYATFGFEQSAKLDEGNMWPTSFALTKLGDAEEKKIAALVRKAVG